MKVEIWEGIYHHGKHRIRGLKTVRTLFPEITIPLNSGDITTNTISRLSDNHIRSCIGGPGGKGLRDAEATDAAANDHAVHGAIVLATRIGFLASFGWGYRGLLSNGTPHSGADTANFPISPTAGRERNERAEKRTSTIDGGWDRMKKGLGRWESSEVSDGSHGGRENLSRWINDPLCYLEAETANASVICLPIGTAELASDDVVHRIKINHAVKETNIFHKNFKISLFLCLRIRQFEVYVIF